MSSGISEKKEQKLKAITEDLEIKNYKNYFFNHLHDPGMYVGILQKLKDLSESETIKIGKEYYQLFKFSFEIFPVPMLFVSKNRTVIIQNQAHLNMFGLNVVGKKLYEPGPNSFTCTGKINDSAKKRRDEFERIINEGGVSRLIAEHKDRNTGKVKTFEIWMNTVKDKGNVIGVIIVTHDITGYMRIEEEKKKLEVQFQQAQKLETIGTLAAGIAHNFNNLLAGIQGYTYLMFLDIDESHPHYERLKSIEKQIQSGIKLTRQLLGYAREKKYAVKPINLNQLVEETSEIFSRTRKEIMIYRELAENLFAIEADQGQIEQVLLNLYVNAVDAMPGGGTLLLKTMNTTHHKIKSNLYNIKPGNYVRLTVIDTGIGMNKETIERIFDPFFTTKEIGQGTGLGLASIYGIIRGHHGYIDVESKKGQGTTFNIYLPASEKKVQETTIKTSGQIIIKGSGVILFVDDETTILNVCISILKRFGYTVLGAKNGREAVEVYKANKNKIDLVILDIIMPDMNGSEVYNTLKKINPNVKVIFLSGYDINSINDMAEILKCEYQDFIQKPFNIEALSSKIKKVLDIK